MDNGDPMIKLAIKHKILDLCIDKFFSTVRKNFPSGDFITVQVSTLGDHNIKQYIGYDIIDLKLDPDVSEYMRSYEYIRLKSNITEMTQEFPVQIRAGNEPHTA